MYRDDLKALHLLRQNVRSLLLYRKETEAALAAHLGFKHRSSLNKFLNSERAGFQMWRLDRLAGFFGLSVYQLFQPGISPLLERRKNKTDRRSGLDRRLGHARRELVALTVEMDKNRYALPVSRGEHAATSSQALSSRDVLAGQVRALIEDTEHKLATLLSQADPRDETPTTDASVSTASARHRTMGRSRTKKA